jgi:hypothetical protein
VLQQCVPTVISGFGGSLVPRKRVIDRHTLARKAFLAHAMAWTLNNGLKDICQYLADHKKLMM